MNEDTANAGTAQVDQAPGPAREASRDFPRDDGLLAVSPEQLQLPVVFSADKQEADSPLSGFRLKRLEVYNWGTFHREVWSFKLDGKNALLTGDIGSGKSTLVDAITTLLVPAQRAASAYNKAAGADSKERTIRSYVLGYYKTERSEDFGSAKPVALRDYNSYSVVLAVFENLGYNQTISLAQVFHMKDLVGQPARFFVAAERDLTISADFSGFGSDIGRLRKRLREDDRVEIFDSYPPYGAWFRRRFGIEHEQALDLFHQTISMKSIGNLTDFVRQHMLEPSDVESRREALIKHFDDLSEAHNAVLTAARQIDLLKPLVADCEKRAERLAHCEELKISREALKPYFAKLKQGLLEQRIASLEHEWVRADAQVRATEERLKGKQIEERELRRSIQENGGDRIDQLSLQIAGQTEELKRRREKAERYADLLRSLGRLPAESPDDFAAQQQQISGQASADRDAQAQRQNELTEASVDLRKHKEEHDKIAEEVASLKSRRSNIPSDQIKMRDMLCNALGLQQDDLPYAGELLQVRDEARDWEGAAERLLRNFALSLLVPEQHYSAVADFVDKTHLRGRLVYFRVRDNVRATVPQTSRDSLARKIAIKPQSVFYDFLEREVAARFDYVCCETREQFRRETRAITASGQTKQQGDRHEKDDRHYINDRSRYVLGWTNAAKIDALEKQARVLQSQIQELAGHISETQRQQQILADRIQVALKIEEYADYREIDWATVAAEIARLEGEKRALESASNILKQLTDRLAILEDEIGQCNSELQDYRDERTRKDQQLKDSRELFEEAKAVVDGAADSLSAERFELLETMRTELLGDHRLILQTCHNREQDMRNAIQTRIDAESRRARDLEARIIEAMTKYKSDYPLAAQDVDISLGSADEFAKMLGTLQADDLPRFQAQFKMLLNENTINEVAHFQSYLFKQREEIKERIELINQSLVQIDYNAGRYILLQAHPTLDVEIKDFQVELRGCTEGSLSAVDDEQYSEQKFLQVKSIIERFRGREGRTDPDTRWTNKVTDVRNWFSFSASERSREDDSEYEHYSDSGGKSGGQKEKLAYTILAASLAYQFGLEWDAKRSRSFRFVVIDEAFGRGSDESARYALSLFAKLSLQLLVVTPMQKIHVIEPFVETVGFVHNDGGSASKLRNLTIDEYRNEKARMLHEVDKT